MHFHGAESEVLAFVGNRGAVRRTLAANIGPEVGTTLSPLGLIDPC